jgi:hypothetical protein
MRLSEEGPMMQKTAGWPSIDFSNIFKGYTRTRPACRFIFQQLVSYPMGLA